jgi:ribosomal protein L23
VKVNTLCMSSRTRRFRGVVGRVPGYKKAMVSLKKGQVIDAEGGVR